MRVTDIGLKLVIGLQLGLGMGLVLNFPVFFSQYYPELFPLRTITVISKLSGTPKVHVSPVPFDTLSLGTAFPCIPLKMILAAPAVYICPSIGGTPGVALSIFSQTVVQFAGSTW